MRTVATIILAFLSLQTLLADKNMARADVIALDAPQFRGVFVIPDPNATTTTINVVLNRGELDNPFEQGLAHYLEHLVWLNAEAETQAIAGPPSNAWTTLKTTSYRFRSEGFGADGAFAKLHKVFAPITPKYADRERGIVTRELETRTLENPFYALQRKLAKALYQDTALGRSVLGSKPDIAKYDFEKAFQLHQQSHKPENAVLVIRTAEYHMLVLKRLPTFAAINEPTKSHLNLSVLKADETQTIEEPKINGSRLIIGYLNELDEPIEDQKLWSLLDLLSEFLGSTYSGSIVQPLQYEDFVAQELRVGLSFIDQVYFELWINSVPEVGVSLQALEDKLTGVIAELHENGFPAEALEKIRNRRLLELDELQNSPSRVEDFVFRRLGDRLLPLSIEQEKIQLLSINLQDFDPILSTIARPN